jgi:O-succinylbenzoic acid--CoA ligase
MEKFDPDRVNIALETGHVTLASFVPTMLRRLLEVRQGRLPLTVRAILLGGAAAPQDLLARALAAGWPIASTYGLTEACSQVATATPDETNHKPGSVGKPLMFTQLEIAAEEGHVSPPDKVGEIVVRGPTVMQGYYRDQEATYHALYDGWLHTGD